MAFLAPLAEMAGAAAAPALESLVGEEAAKVVSPTAEKALKSLVTSKHVTSGLHKLGNKFFGSKAGKTARNIAKKSDKVMGVVAGKQAHKLLGSGLEIGKGLGIIDDNQAKNVLDAHAKAMSLHDKLSAFNKKDDPLKPKVDMKDVMSAAQAMAPAVASAIPASAPAMAAVSSALGGMSAAGGGINDTRPRHDKVIPSQIHVPQPYETF